MQCIWVDINSLPTSGFLLVRWLANHYLLSRKLGASYTAGSEMDFVPALWNFPALWYQSDAAASCHLAQLLCHGGSPCHCPALLVASSLSQLTTRLKHA